MAARVIYRVHSSPGRTRLRLRWLRREPQLATSLADALEKLPGVELVEVRPYTGSLLCTYEPGALTEQALLEKVRQLTGVERVLHPGESVPGEEEAELLRAIETGSNLAVEASRFFKGLNVDLLRATEGRVDLPTLATLGFLVAGATEVVVTKKLPMPPWFNLSWWAFSTFIRLEKRVIRQTEPPHWHAEGPHEA